MSVCVCTRLMDGQCQEHIAQNAKLSYACVCVYECTVRINFSAFTAQRRENSQSERQSQGLNTLPFSCLLRSSPACNFVCIKKFSIQSLFVLFVTRCSVCYSLISEYGDITSVRTHWQHALVAGSCTFQWKFHLTRFSPPVSLSHLRRKQYKIIKQ